MTRFVIDNHAPLTELDNILQPIDELQSTFAADLGDTVDQSAESQRK